MTELSRRGFMKEAGAGLAGLGLAGAGLTGAGLASPAQAVAATSPLRPAAAPVDGNAVSLATWSLNRSFAAGIWTLSDIARICREDFDIDGVEYVTIFFKDVRQDFLKELNQRAADYGVRNVLIMVDREGDMASPDRKERMQAAVNHRKWVDIAHFLGCHAIRCNATGGGATPKEDPGAVDRAAEAFHALLDYARDAGINIIIENHGGGVASNARWLAALAEKVDDPLFGLLPDYGNFRAETPEDTYEAVRLTMPYAKGVSVKGGWSPEGEHLRFSLEKCLEISKAAGFTGYWGIESSFRRGREDAPVLSPLQIMNEEWQAVRWTKQAIDKVVLT